ncbi:ATP-binding protein [Pedobacter jeongneungensis]|uniref:ATP-binding protein n=1 Tax=Pedobacter jeongneungensis TaxID=947309 RepID=UPI000467FC51|nr:ATP-binding protein [Pedobacter jeongneungensis]
MNTADLTNCDKEPIHIPGNIQRHGFLIVVDKDHMITHCSENVVDHINMTSYELLGHIFDDFNHLFGKDDESGFLGGLMDLASGSSMDNAYPLNFGSQDWNLIVHNSGEFFLLDFEPQRSDLEPDLQDIVGQSLSQILGDRNLGEILKNASLKIRELIAYDRVMIYRFDQDGDGEVVAEACDPGLDSWVGLHYPASDIPRQARDLYRINLTRLISDVDSAPSPVRTKLTAPLDLTHSPLRAVSPIHIQYLKNMGVASSFSVSLVHKGELWGLIACHNYTPRFINFNQRRSAKLIGQILSSAISYQEQQQEQHLLNQQQSAIAALSSNLLKGSDVNEALFDTQINIGDAVSCSGAAMLFDNELSVCGEVPAREFLEPFFAWLSENMKDDIFDTDDLAAIYPASKEVAAQAAGVMVCRLAKDLPEFLIWFRPEKIKTVNWAGNPHQKSVSIDPMEVISPRNSFELWIEEVRGRSLKWLPHERRIALLLRDEINYAIGRKATELRALNLRLRDAYAELDTFAYTVSHDLKNPITVIKSYAQLIMGAKSIGQAGKMADKIHSSAERMRRMIDEILDYSRAGQSALSMQHIELLPILEEIRADLLLSYPGSNLEINFGPTPSIQGDRLMIRQVFSNLMENAVKYSQENENATVTVTGEIKGEGVQYSIIDNGMGIDELEHGKVFELFERSSEVKAISGTGVGLAIVKRIMERHEGSIRLESEPGKGTIFYLEFIG